MELDKIPTHRTLPDTAKTLGLGHRKNSGLGLRTPVKKLLNKTIGAYFLLQ
jgi:hypothetical protein